MDEPVGAAKPDETAREPPARIDAAFRNGSLTAISVVLGFSLSFLNRWAALPGPWLGTDLAAVAAIAVGIVAQVIAVASLLSTRSLGLAYYHRAVVTFLVGLACVAIGVALAIAGDLVAGGQRVLG
ncbi:hypothetical protein [Alsobacter sp. SYSU BS001988]|jgi:hypothetical protein